MLRRWVKRLCGGHGSIFLSSLGLTLLSLCFSLSLAYAGSLGEMLMVYYLASAYICVRVYSGMHLPALWDNFYHGHPWLFGLSKWLTLFFRTFFYYKYVVLLQCDVKNCAESCWEWRQENAQRWQKKGKVKILQLLIQCNRMWSHPHINTFTPRRLMWRLLICVSLLSLDLSAPTPWPGSQRIFRFLQQPSL